MTIIHVLPWPLWLALVIAVLVAVALATRRPLGVFAILVILTVGYSS